MTSRRLFALTRAIFKIRTLRVLLDDFEVRRRPWGQRRPGDGVLAWGMRPSALRARAYAAKHGLAVWHIEDGFLRSIGLGKADPPLSVVLDDLGIYFDAGRPSRLEASICRPLDEVRARRAEALAEAWRAGRVSKYNHDRDIDLGLPDDCILVIDQTWGDSSITYGGARPETFQRMLDAALAENPGSTILLKVHPEVVSGRKQGHFNLDQVRASPRVRVLDDAVSPASLFERVGKVYTVTSQMGFEALLWRLPVRVFGMPFYAGWGLTQDELPGPSRRLPVPLTQLVHAALVDYPRYVDPMTGTRCEVETLLARIASQRRTARRIFPRFHAAAGHRWTPARMLRELTAWWKPSDVPMRRPPKR